MPNLSRLQATCDVNYSKLLNLLPECDNDSLSYRFHDGKDMTYAIQIVEVSPYTSTLEICQQHEGLPAYVQPSMQVRLYHDVRMAEVLKSQHVGAFKASYSYPNKKMHQPNEKEMVNSFLYEWLLFCHQHIASREVFNQ